MQARSGALCGALRGRGPLEGLPRKLASPWPAWYDLHRLGCRAESGTTRGARRGDVVALPIPLGTKCCAPNNDIRKRNSSEPCLLTPNRRTGHPRGQRQASRLRKLAGKQCGARYLHLARCSPQTYANLERHRATDPARAQAAHLQSQGLSERRLVGAPLNRSPHRRKIGNRNQGIHQMGTA